MQQIVDFRYIISVIKDILPSVCTVAVAIISSKMVIISANKSVNQLKSEKLQTDLESFYYPFLLLSKKTTQLYKAFSQVSKEDCDSCLVFLFSGKKFDGNALAIWKEIILNNKKLNDLIIKYSTIINNKSLRDDLSNLSTHYTLLDLANNNNLTGNEDVLREYAFPSTVIENIEIEIDNILKIIEDLNK
jgi:hypothetical protein